MNTCNKHCRDCAWATISSWDQVYGLEPELINCTEKAGHQGNVFWVSPHDDACELFKDAIEKLDEDLARDRESRKSRQS